MSLDLASYFAYGSGRGAGIFVIFFMLIAAATWWPSHHFFKWVRKHYYSEDTFLLSVLGCSVLSVLLVILGMWVGTHLSPDLRSFGAKGAGGMPVDVNFMWLPFGCLALGIWAGFLSGYVKMPIHK